jgi:hypothetical protein
MIIYCLNLELNRIFLYVRSQNNISVQQSHEYILLEAEIYYNYLQKYKPISIIKKIETTIDNDNDNDNDKLLDIYVKENMICGINTVHEEHCCSQELALFKIDKIRHCKHANNEYVENLITKYLCKNRTIEKILFEKQELENTLEKYKKEKQELENISIDGSQIIENIRWIQETCSRKKNINKNDINKNEKKENINKNDINKNEKKENINRYKKILLSLNQVYTIFSSISTSSFSTYSKNTNDIYTSEDLKLDAPKGRHFTPLNILNGTPEGVPLDVSRATLPINQLKSTVIKDDRSNSNVHRCKSLLVSDPLQIKMGHFNSSRVYIKYPNFLLDDFFCHWHRKHLEEYMKEVEIFCSIYEEMTNVIIQKMKEIESNIKTYDDDLEWKISRALYMLNKEYTNLMLQ